MGRKQKQARKEAGEAKRRRGWRVAIIVGVVLAIPAFFVGQAISRRSAVPAPFGVALPEVVDLVTWEGIDRAQPSIIDNEIPDIRLAELAPEADGLPPLGRSYLGEISSCRILVYNGAEITMFGPSAYLEDGVEGSIKFHFGNPLAGLQVRHTGREEGQSPAAYVAALRTSLAAEGAELKPELEPLVVCGLPFEQLEYVRPEGVAGQNSYFAFFAPAGATALLVLQFACAPEHHEQARPYVLKIMQAIEIEEKLVELARQEPTPATQPVELPEAATPAE